MRNGKKKVLVGLEGRQAGKERKEEKNRGGLKKKKS